MVKQPEYDAIGAAATAADPVLWIDPQQIDPGSWLPVPLHSAHSTAAGDLSRAGWTQARLAGWSFGFGGAFGDAQDPHEAELPRLIPHERVRHLPTERARVTRLPARMLVARVRRRRIFMLPAPTYEQRRGRAAAWGLLIVWLIGTWGTFYGLTGGLRSHENSKAIVVSSGWGW